MTEDRSSDEGGYQEIYDRALERVSAQAPRWTHREVSDPGITFLETWALLADMQNFYADRIGEEHYRKYLKLLGIARDEGECAVARIFFDKVDRDCVLPKGTKFLAGNMVFEPEEEIRLCANTLTGFYPEPDQNRIGTMRMRRKTSFALKEQTPLFALTLEKAVEQGRELDLFILLDEQKPRNPSGEDFRMAYLSWEYLSYGGWREAEIREDETKGLLYSGRIRLYMREKMLSDGKGYGVRCRVREGAYDRMPVLYKIFLNVGKAVQRETLCDEEKFKMSREQSAVALGSYLARTGEVAVFLGRGRGEWEEITPECGIDPPITAERLERHVRLPARLLSGENVSVKVVSSARKALEEYRPCHITGVSSQQITLPWTGIRYDRLRLMLRQRTGGNLYREYHLADIESCGAYIWHRLESREGIVLGDGRHGVIPNEAHDGLLLTSLVLSGGAEGNVAINKIKEWEQPELFGDITLRNLLAGCGGRDAKKPSQQFAAAGEMLSRPNRLVTEEDILFLAKETPGLLIEEVKAYRKNGTVVVEIVPMEPLQSAYCREKYRKAVADHLEPYRIMGSRLAVVIAGED
ncbi:MAG: hypothetical protein NC079_02735 [Clostridium sp.]|nr:hypothetical protein [Acetatifactor muris]MCM1527169.1 hypothetical protein [Bacteroides sp.]MCM1562506.1 hypothetical protein [Clostridium sp.]